MKKSQIGLLSGIFVSYLFLVVSCNVDPDTTTTLPGGETTTSTSSTTSTSTTSTTLALGEAVYVSSSGSDANDGMYPATPLLSLDKALEIAVASNASYLLVAGNYTLSSNTTSKNAGWLIENVDNLVISGGWNDDFTTQNVKSILEAAINGFYVSMCNNLIRITGCQYLSFTNFVLSNCMNNSGGGGGIYAADLDGCIISIDSLLNAASSGGGLYLCDSTGVYVTGYFYFNDGGNGSGGGVCLSNVIDTSLNALVDYNSISGNYGGGLAVFNSSNIVIEGTFSGNDAVGGAYCGGVYIENVRGLSMDALVYGNHAYSGYYGGMELCNLTNAYINVVLTNNSAQNYSGIDIGGVYDLSLNGLIAGNRTTQSSTYGGGLSIQYCDTIEVDADIERNYAAIGGGAYVMNVSNIIFSGSFTGNAARNGGGIAFMSDAYNCYVTADLINNFATNSGGGVYCANSVSNAFLCEVTGNTSRNGGGFYFSSCSGMTLMGNIANNVAFTNGGGIYMSGTRECSLILTSVISNLAGLNGGGLYLASNSTNNTVGIGSSIVYNHADSDGNATGTGGGMYLNPLTQVNTINSSVVTNPNFIGSETTTTNFLGGI